MAVETTDSINAGEHGALRWDQRTSPESVAPETAWRDAHQMPIPTPEYRDVDELRYYPPDEVVLVRRGSVLRTVIPMTGPQSQRSRVLQRAVENQFGAEFTHE